MVSTYAGSPLSYRMTNQMVRALTRAVAFMEVRVVLVGSRGADGPFVGLDFQPQSV